MDEIPSPIAETRGPQIYPVLTAAEIDRLRRFGTPRDHADGEQIVRVGDVGHGLTLVLDGQVAITETAHDGERRLIVRYGSGAFMGELAQLNGGPALVDATAESAVSVIAIPPEGLRALLVAEAELGERIMRALILRRVALMESGVVGPIIVGREDDPEVRRLEGFLDRNSYPRQRLDPATDVPAQALIERFHVAPEELPIVLCPDGRLLRNPTEDQLARCLGMVGPIDPDRVFDVAVVGAGPAGLATAVYAASEGLSVLVLDCRSFGGQAGASARIENYLGFPTGIRGLALMARAYHQARKFGVEMAIPDQANALEPDPAGGHALRLADGERVRARAVVIATGARYRRLALPDLPHFEAASVHYWASPLEARLCAGQEVVLVGGGNSAGQAVVYLASQVKKVWLLVRGPGLEASMSRYLIDRIAAQPNVELVTHAEVSALHGTDANLETVCWRDVRDGAETRVAARHLFLFIGADPNTDWLADAGVALDGAGFVQTGQSGGHALESSLGGVFAIGDVRAGSVKRVAACVGEGAQVVAALHKHLANVAAAAKGDPQPA
jgi:thioredoxin reductase (NADPH)